MRALCARRTMAVLVALPLLAGCGGGGSATAEPTTEPSASVAPEPLPSPDAKVPELEGETGADADAILTDLGMVPTFTLMSSGDEVSDLAGFTVISTYPAAGEDVHSNRAVTVFGRQDVADPPATAVVPADAMAAQRVVDAFAAAGLPVRDARDNKTGNCAERGCSQMVTTEDITVLSFGDDAAASTYVETWGPESLHRSGAIVLSYAAARTPLETRPLYEAALAALEP